MKIFEIAPPTPVTHYFSQIIQARFKRQLKYFSEAVLILFAVALTACGGGGGGGEGGAIPDSGPFFVSTEVTIQAIQVELLGDPDDVYKLSLDQEDDPSFEPSLQSIGRATANLSNRSSDITLVDGNFYRINIEFEENVGELQFQVVVLDLLNEQSQTLIPLYVEYEELDGERTISADLLIPADIPSGEYILLASISDESLVGTDRPLTIDEIPGIGDIGGIKVTITKNPDPDTLFVVAAEGTFGEDILEEEESFVDLFYPADYAESGGRKFTSEPVGEVLFSYYNTSEVTKVLELQATLTLEDGSSYPLYLMDPSSETGLLTKVIRLEGVHYRDDLGEFFVMYYLEDIDHDQILTKVPDLAYDLSDGNVGTVTWSGRVLDAPNSAGSFNVPVLVAKFNDVEVFDPAAVLIAGQGGVKTEPLGETNPIAATEFANGKVFTTDGKYHQRLGNPDLFSVDVAAEYEVKGRWNLLQIEAMGKHTADFTVFGTTKSIYSVEAEVANGLRRLSPASPTSVETRRFGNRAVITALGSTFYNQGVINSEQISLRATAGQQGALIAESLATVTPTLSAANTWNENTQLFSARPLGLFTARLFVQGSMEANMTAEFPPKVTLIAPLGLDIYGTAGVDIVIAEAGIQGRVNMLNMTNTGSVGGDLKLSPANNIVFDINNRLDTTLKILQGNVSAYTDCPIFCSRKTYNIFSSGWLFNRSWPVSNSTVAGMPQNGGL